MRVFDFQSYKLYLQACFPAQGEKRGSRRALAEVVGCGAGFISQVLNDELHFSQEQAISVSYFLGMNEEEREFFIILLNRDRAGSEKLREFYDQKRKEILKRRSEIKTHIKDQQEMPKEFANIYYSQAKYQAIHMAIRNPRLFSEELISRYLDIEIDEVRRAVDFLVQSGLVKLKGKRLEVTERRIHLSEQSGSLERHHVNWRLDVVREVLHAPKKGIHYTSVMSISKKAHEEIKEMLLKLVEKSEPIIHDAADEQVSVLLFDLYELGAKK